MADKKQPKPSVFTISPWRSFVDVLAESLLLEAGPDPLHLASMTVLLPTRRACRAMAEAFLRLSEGRTVLLPRLTPLGDVDEEALEIAEGEDGSTPAVLDIPPAISSLRRQILLARLILARKDGPDSPAQALALAQELARLLDQVATERLDFADLNTLALEELAEHWQVTLDFLKILTENWPHILSDEGTIDPADRRNRLLAARCDLWSHTPPTGPVIAAGSTGSIPATADLLTLVAGLPNGRVVLPGLDQTLSDQAWAALEPAHPQYGLSILLGRLGIPRAAVQEWAPDLTGGRPAKFATNVTEELSKSAALRTRYLTRALVPASETGAPPEPLNAQDAEIAFQNVRSIACENAREEAHVIALHLREALEIKGKTAAVVTADADLARRVAEEMTRWGIDVDNSAGTPLDQTQAGAFLRLVADMVAQDFAPVPMLAALKHPFAACGCERSAFRRLVRQLEIAVLRGVRPAPGLDGIRAALSQDTHSHMSMDQRTRDQLFDLLDLLKRCTQPLIDAAAAPDCDLASILYAHGEVMEALADSADTEDISLWSGDAGEALAQFISDAIQSGAGFTGITLQTYATALETMMAGIPVRPKYGAHPRLSIWGLLEARLQHADLMILAGLNEGSWPPEAKANPWMGRPMLRQFGLPQPERRIGLAAHDFSQAFAAPEVVITRSTRVDGAESRPARWLSRLNVILQVAGQDKKIDKGHSYRHWAVTQDKPQHPVAVASRPAPCPPVAARPTGLSVTRIETWIRDPYAIYADKVLGLKPLDPLDADPGAADRGILIHAILESFIGQNINSWPEDAEARLVAIGTKHFKDLSVRPGVRAFWWPRFLRIATWFCGFEQRRRSMEVSPLTLEAKGTWTIPGPGSDFDLVGVADRIDKQPDGRLAILDYKTGQVPGKDEVKIGLAPQLPLEAAILLHDGFQDIRGKDVGELTFIQLTGGRQAGKATVHEDVHEWIEKAINGLKRRIALYQLEGTPYPPQVKPKFDRYNGDYDHLSRRAEWRVGGTTNPSSKGDG